MREKSWHLFFKEVEMHPELRKMVIRSLLKEATLAGDLETLVNVLSKSRNVEMIYSPLRRIVRIGAEPKVVAPKFRIWPWLAVGGAAALGYGLYKNLKTPDPYAQYYGLGKLGERLLLMRLLGF
jgi:hypothetical protein